MVQKPKKHKKNKQLKAMVATLTEQAREISALVHKITDMPVKKVA